MNEPKKPHPIYLICSASSWQLCLFRLHWLHGLLVPMQSKFLQDAYIIHRVYKPLRFSFICHKTFSRSFLVAVDRACSCLQSSQSIPGDMLSEVKVFCTSSVAFLYSPNKGKTALLSILDGICSVFQLVTLPTTLSTASELLNLSTRNDSSVSLLTRVTIMYVHCA